MLLLTSGQIATEIGTDRDRVSYAIRKAGIQPVGRAGLVRLLPQSAVAPVKGFLDAKRVSNQSQSPVR
jgi:hypothetical protein